jgi:hypothetical protein
VVAGRCALRASAVDASPAVNPRPRNPSSASDSISEAVSEPTLAVTPAAGGGTTAAPAGAAQGWAFLVWLRRDCMKAAPKIRSAS